MKNSIMIKRMVGIASLAAVVAVLQVLSLFIKFGTFSITLALVPLVVGAILYGVSGGAILGFVMGFIVLLTNSEAFFVINPFATIVLCILKSTLAGMAAGALFKLFRKKNVYVAVILASISAPLVNTGVFALGCMAFFFPTLKEWAAGSNALGFLFLGLIGVNFIIEFVVNSVLSPVIFTIVRIASKNYNIGCTFDIDDEEVEKNNEILE